MDRTINDRIPSSVVHREFKQTVRCRITLVLLGIGLVFAYAIVRQYGIGGGPNSRTPLVLESLGGNTTLAAAQGVASPFVFVAGLLLGYRAISEERNRSLIVTASMPYSRSDILLGKVLARSLVVLVLTAVPVAIVFVACAIWYGVPSLLRTFGFFIVTIGYAVSCVAVGVGLSAGIRSAYITTLLVLVLLIVMLLWEPVLSRLIYLHASGSEVPYASGGESDPSASFLFLQRLAPDGLYNAATNTIIGAPNTPWNAGIAVEAAAPNHTVFHVFPIGDVFHSTPVYLTGEFSLLVLVAWAAIPLGLGYARFRMEDVR